MISETAIRRTAWTHASAATARACLSAIFLISGAGKLLSPTATIAEIASAGLPLPSVSFVIAAAIELLCGAALLAGFRVRWAAGVLAAFTVITAVVFHLAFADPNQLNHFLKNIAMCGGLLHVASVGKGSSP